MKKFIYVFLLFCIYSGMQITAQEMNIRKDGAYLYVEQMPEFPGGSKAMSKFIKDNPKYPEEAYKKGIEGMVAVQFVVETDGRIGRIAIVHKADPILEKEAARVIASMPSWIPGKQDGKAVPVVYTVPVRFKKAAKQKIVKDNPEVEKPELAGVWQMCIQPRMMENKDYSVLTLPCIKHLSPDKKFVTIVIETGDRSAFITGQGTYKQKGEDEYVEHVSHSALNPQLDDQKVLIKFKFLNSNLIEITLGIQADHQDPVKEYWMRVEEPAMLPHL